MNSKAQTRVNEITAEIAKLMKRSERLDISQTERAQIAIDLRRLLTERENIINKNNPVYKTVDSDTLFNIVQRWI